MNYTTNTPQYRTTNASYEIVSYTNSSSYGVTYSPVKRTSSRGVCTCMATGVCRGTCRV